jgi:hypothetical protein
MPSYYFPFGASKAAPAATVDLSDTAVTASRPDTPVNNKRAITASYAVNVTNVPVAGATGVSQNATTCGASTVVGITGPAGTSGIRGTDYIPTCPENTIECPNLHVSLSANWTNPINGGPGVNYFRPSGSQFVRVCMEIPPGCSSTTAVCPPALPTSSVTSTFPNIP